MNNNKTGNFISALRKEKGLTQARLAEKLNVTDKAVSRWETGKGMPDSSLLIPLADTLGITVNELLVGEKIPADAFARRSEDNLVTAVKKTEKAVRQGKKIKVFLLIAIIFCAFSLSFLIKTAIENKNTVTYVGDFGTQNRIAVTELLIELNSRNRYFTRNTVCTDFDIWLNSQGEIINAEITMNDESMHEYISVVLLSPSEQPGQLSYVITRKSGYYSAEDGILFTDLCEFLKNEDFTEAAVNYNKIGEFNEIYITGTSTLYFNFDGLGNTGFHNQHIFSDGKFRKIWNNEGMKGKYYEIGVGTFNRETGENNTCFSVYIPR